MFYGQNCSGRLGEKKTVIGIVGSNSDYSYAKILSLLNLRNIKRELNESYFSKSVELANKYKIKVSLGVISSKEFSIWKDLVKIYPKWFGKLYGIICYKILKPILDKKINMHMDREYDSKTLNFAVDVINEFVDLDKKEVYIRKEREYPSNRIIVADLFARGCFRNFNCSNLIINKNLEIKNEIKKIFRKTR